MCKRCPDVQGVSKVLSEQVWFDLRRAKDQSLRLMGDWEGLPHTSELAKPTSGLSVLHPESALLQRPTRLANSPPLCGGSWLLL